MGRTNPRGDASNPIVNAREKLIVAQVERVAPRNRSEKDCMTCSCCELTLRSLTDRTLMYTGRAYVAAAMAKKANTRLC